MLKELSKYENLGTPKIFLELFKLVGENKQPWTQKGLKEYLFNRIIDGQSIYDGCLPLAQAVGAVVIDGYGVVGLKSSLAATLANEKDFSFKFLGVVMEALKDDETFHQIFCSENISYDIIYKQILVENSAFQFRYSNFRHLLLNFAFLLPHPDGNPRKLIINPKYRDLFDSKLMPEIRKRKIGIEELKKMFAKREISGKEGEAFVLRYEQKRLMTHKQVNNVEIISEYYTNAGYDVVSYENVDSKDHDRFIEVKSYQNNLRFYWSRNEMDVARIKKNQYFLYLVDRSQMNNENYVPLIIQNPHEQILEKPEQWEKLVDGYLITQAMT